MKLKKLIATMLVITSVCGMTACGKENKKPSGSSHSSVITCTPKPGGEDDPFVKPTKGADPTEEPKPTEEPTATDTPAPTEEPTPTSEPTPTEAPSQGGYAVITPVAEIKTVGGVLVSGKQAFEVYNYREDYATQYAKVVNDLGTALSGKAKVYSIVIPLSTGITMPDKYMGSGNSSNMKDSVDKIMAKLGNSVVQVPIYDTLMKHRTEYIYFRTDHHWTQLGAYYAYVEYCKKANLTAESLSDLPKVEFPGFTGSFCKDTNVQTLYDNPDTIVAYKPKSNCTMTVTDKNGKEFNWRVINDVSNYQASIKYSTFVAGDNPYTVITNSDLSDNSACIIIKESFGNAFAPFLVDHYQKVYIIDYRYYKGKISDLVAKTGAKDVILANNVSMIRNKYLIGQLAVIAK